MATIEELTAKVAGLEQQMAAITAPPTEYYTSAYSGEDIDAAIKKVNDGIVGVLQTKVNRKNEKSPAKFTRPKMGITKQAGEKSHRQPG